MFDELLVVFLLPLQRPYVSDSLIMPHHIHNLAYPAKSKRIALLTLYRLVTFV